MMAARPPAPGPPGLIPGTARLEVETVGGVSRVVSLFSHQPLRLLAPVASGPSVWAYTSSFGGGLVGGDRTRLDLVVGPGSRCFLGSQSATKVYRNATGNPCEHRTLAGIGPGALLAFLPDPVQPFAAARYRQRQEFRMSESGGLVLLDIVTAGRPARGERWAFADFESRTEIRVGDRLRFLDLLALQPDDGVAQLPRRLGRFDALAALVVLGPPVGRLAAAILEQVARSPLPRRGALIATASPLGEGVVVRLAGERTEAVLAEVRRLLEPLSVLLGDNPWSRHW